MIPGIAVSQSYTAVGYFCIVNKECHRLCLSVSGLLPAAEHMGPRNLQSHALFVVKLLIPSCVKRSPKACC